MSGSLYSLSRKEGWRRYAEAPARERPGQLPPGQLKRLGGAAREEYDDARHDWHANFGILRTPQLAAVHGELEVIVAAGRCWISMPGHSACDVPTMGSAAPR